MLPLLFTVNPIIYREHVETEEQFFTSLPTAALRNKSNFPFILQEKKSRFKIG
jgi:hypothetical protein